MNYDKTINTILEVAASLVVMESRGHLLNKQEPTPRLVIFNDHKSDYGFTTHIELAFPHRAREHETETMGNWGGVGKTLEEALEGNILCLGYELKDRLAELNTSLEKVRAIMPTKFKNWDK